MPRCNTSWGIGLTDTFRNRSRKLFDKFGTNQQNISSHISTIYVPDKNKVFVSADCAGAEALIVAYLVPDGNFRSLFNVGIKPHVFVALHLFSYHWKSIFGSDTIDSFLKLSPINLVNQDRWKEVAKAIKSHDQYYFIGKKSCHSFNYRKQPSSFIFDVLKESEGKVVLSKKEGERIHGIYHSLFPEIEQVWHKEQDELIRSTRTLRNLYGYPRTFYGTFTDKFFREATAFIPQSTIGCLTNIAYTNIQSHIESNKLDWDLLNNKHDSVMLQCPIGMQSDAIKLLQDSLEQTLTSPRGETFKMKSEVSVGTNWGKYNELTNPNGLKEI